MLKRLENWTKIVIIKAKFLSMPVESYENFLMLRQCTNTGGPRLVRILGPGKNRTKVCTILV